MITLQGIEMILFDLGNVVVDLDEKASYRALQALSEQKRLSVESAASHSFFKQFETGVISDASFRDELRGLLDNSKLDDQQIDHAWNAMILDIDPQLIQLLIRLKEHMQIMVLSNTNSIHERAFHKILSEKTAFGHINEVFHKVYLSHEIGERKPDLNAWQLIIDDNDSLSGEKILFLDDKPENLEAAKRLGIRTFQINKPKETIDLVNSFKYE